MHFLKKNLYVTVIAVITIVFTIVMALLPWKPSIQPGAKQSWNEAQASIAELISNVQSNNYDCPFSRVSDITVDARHPPRTSSERTRFFVEDALPVIREQSSVRDRIITAADLAIRCKVFFGSCGRSAGAIYALAGVGDEDDPAPTTTDTTCLFSSDGCNLDLRKRRVPDTDEGMYLRAENSRRIRGRNCSAPTSSRRRDCFDSAPQAKRQVASEISRSLVGYPNRWANHLQPGDWLYIYNGNSTPIGSHSIIFLGWENEAQGQAWIFEGNPRSWLGSSHTPVSERLAETRVRLNRACLKAECGNYYPIVQVYDPESAELVN